jgi:hypothetical protein
MEPFDIHKKFFKVSRKDILNAKLFEEVEVVHEEELEAVHE